MSYRDRILGLRDEGKTYSEIADILKCSKSIVCYHCSESRRENSRARLVNRYPRWERLLLKSCSRFINRDKRKTKDKRQRKWKRRLREGCDDFQRRVLGRHRNNMTFSYKDVVAKYGMNPKCYLTGEELNFLEPESYQLDHIIPVSKNGDNSLDNLGVVSPQANRVKSDLTVDELLDICRRILIHNGYIVSKN